jgi:hypothetical protein
MMYRNFAIATLLAAPIVVMGVQAFMPKPEPTAPSPSGARPADAAPPPVPVAPPVTVPAIPPSSDTANFGQPMPGAGQPMLAPGAGLPQASEPAGVDSRQSYEPGSAPAGSPNAEP